MVNLRSQTVSGLKWSGAAQAIRQLLRFATSILLARLLSPHEFGLVGMIVVFSGFAGIFSELGLGAAVIHKQNLNSRDLSSIFWVNLLAGTLFTALFIVGSPWLADFYNEPALQSLTSALAFTFFLASLTTVQRNLLMKGMDFRSLFMIDTLAVLIAGLSAAALAIMGMGAWSLVANTLVFQGIAGLLCWWFSPWRPEFCIQQQTLRNVFGFSSNLLGFNALNYWNRNLDNLLVGRFLGSDSLGIYSLAYTLMLLPISEVAAIFTRVIFPALSAIQDDIVRVKAVYLRATRTIAVVSFPLMLGLLATARPLILLLYGPDWEAAVPVFQILCLAGVFQTIGTTVGWIYGSQGRTDIQFRWGIYVFVVRAIAFVVGLQWGVIGVVVAYVLSEYIFLTYPSWTVAGRIINMTFGEMAMNVLPTLLCASAMAIVVFAVGQFIPPQWSSVVHLGIQVLIGIIVYISLVRFFQIPAYWEVRSLLIEQFQRHG